MTDDTVGQVSKVLIVDDDQREAFHASRHLLEAAPDAGMECIVRGPDDVGDEGDYLELVDALPASAVLIDQRLGETSSAPYSGLHLAQTLREVQPMLPIFILTKYAREDELEAKGFIVDDVMSKSMLRDNPATYVGRLLRAMKRYEDARGAQGRRMRELIAKSVTTDLTAVETNELILLRADIGISRLGREVELAREAQHHLDHKKDILAALDKLIEEKRGR